MGGGGANIYSPVEKRVAALRGWCAALTAMRADLQAAVDAPRQLARQWLQSCGPSADSTLQRER